jgi:hypothetical protein
VIENARWLATLILAEMAGLAGYQKLTDAKRLTIFAAVIIVVLAFGLALFVLDSILARRAQSKAAEKFHSFLKAGREIVNDQNSTDTQRITTITDAERNLQAEFDKYSQDPKIAEFFGFLLFGLATLLAGVFLLGSELIKEIVALLC